VVVLLLLAIWLLLDRRFGAMMAPSHVMNALLCVVIVVLLGVCLFLGRCNGAWPLLALLSLVEWMWQLSSCELSGYC